MSVKTWTSLFVSFVSLLLVTNLSIAGDYDEVAIDSDIRSNFRVISITNDEDKEVTYLSVNLRNGILASFTKHNYLNGKLTHKEVFPLKDSESQYFVLKKQSGHEVVRLKSNTFSAHYGGEIIIDYLYNGVLGSRRNFFTKLEYNGGTWFVTHNGKKVSKLHFNTKRVPIFGSVGIESISIIQ